MRNAPLGIVALTRGHEGDDGREVKLRLTRDVTLEDMKYIVEALNDFAEAVTERDQWMLAAKGRYKPMDGYDNLLAIVEGRVSGSVTEWPAIRVELLSFMDSMTAYAELLANALRQIARYHRDNEAAWRSQEEGWAMSRHDLAALHKGYAEAAEAALAKNPAQTAMTPGTSSAGEGDTQSGAGPSEVNARSSEPPLCDCDPEGVCGYPGDRNYRCVKEAIDRRDPDVVTDGVGNDR